MAASSLIVKLRAFHDDSGRVHTLMFWCPGCSCAHPYTVLGPKPWTFNGDTERPTFTPSLLVHPTNRNPRCHLFLTDGVLKYCSDSGHALAGQAVPLPDFPDGEL